MAAIPLVRWTNGQKQIFVKHGEALIPCASFIEAVNRCQELNQENKDGLQLIHR